jgi:hypothetical protein
MLAATTSINSRLGAGNTDAVALFAQLMPTLAGNIVPTIELVHDPRVPTLPGSTFMAIVLLFHCREKLKQFQTRLFAVLCSAGSRYSDFQKFSLDGWPFLTFFSGNYGAEFSKNCKKGPTIAFQAAPLAHLAYPRARIEIGNPLTTQGRMPVHHGEQSAEIKDSRFQNDTLPKPATAIRYLDPQA